MAIAVSTIAITTIRIAGELQAVREWISRLAITEAVGDKKRAPDQGRP